MVMVRVQILFVAASRIAAARATIDCRTDPTWIGREASCEAQTGWHPRSDLWRDRLDRFEHIVLSDCVADESRLHLAQSRMRARTLRYHHESPKAQIRKEAVLRLGALEDPTITNIYPDPDSPLVVEISFAFSEHEASALRATASCVREYHFDTHFEDRIFHIGGNNCTCTLARKSERVGAL
jgi:hypothetical protein